MEHIRNQSFPAYTTDHWREKAEQTLKGRLADTLKSITYENIVLKPLYTREDESSSPDFPGGPDYRRGTFSLGYETHDWKVAQRISFKTADELKRKMKDAIERGQTAISFEVSKEAIDSCLEEFVDADMPFALNAKWLQHDLLDRIEKNREIKGYIASDPVSLFAETGVISEDFLQGWVNDVVKAAEKFSSLSTVLVDAAPYHNGGANAVQELGIAAAEGVFYLQKLTEAGIGLEKVFSKMIFQFSIGSNFFMELAKLRAARIIWNRITSIYGAKEETRGMQIAAETSAFTKTVFDPHVNLLRAANEAFAAVLGGVQYLNVDPFDNLSGASSFSERIARNIQLILKEETHLRHVVDPAGGSWYVEALTYQLAEKAWEFFQRIEGNGGILEVIKSNWLQQQIAEVNEQRIKDIQTRKQSIIGTNVYAKLDEAAQEIKYRTPQDIIMKDGLKINSIPMRRLAEPFEELRGRAKRLEQQTGTAPAVAMLCLGELKQYKARLDFMKGYIAAGGLKTAESGPLSSLDAAKEFITNSSTGFVCLCGANDQYESIGHELISELKKEFPGHTFFLAGLPDREKQGQWLNEGIKQFIHVKSNCYETLSAILAELEVTADEKQNA